MKQSNKIIIYVISGLFLLLFLTNPPESQFLFKVSQDYGQIHAGTTITTDALLQIGESSRTSYGLFSTYTYRFGNISVNYFGIANRIFFIRSDQQKIISSDHFEKSI